MDIEAEIDRIFRRQYERCKNKLKEVNCPDVFIDTMGKYFNFAKLDITSIIEDRKEKE